LALFKRREKEAVVEMVAVIGEPVETGVETRYPAIQGANQGALVLKVVSLPPTVFNTWPEAVSLLFTRRTTLVATLLGETLGYFVGPEMA
jgi:hypothetical protein